MLDLHIVGAGPAGCFAALSALKGGSSVLVSEEHRQAGIPVNCSGLVSKTGLDALSDFVDYQPSILNQINSAAVHVNGTLFRVKSKSTRAYVIDRAKFDSLCCEKVLGEGGKVEFGSRISSAASLKSNNVIGADGPNSSTASIFSFPQIPRFVSTFQAEFRLRSEDSREVQLFLSRRNFPGFFGWVVPRDEERALVGVGVALPMNSRKSFVSFAASLGLSKSKPKPLSSSAFIIPNSVRPKTAGSFGKRNVLLAGDAAGQAKATTGGGVFFGCSCAKLAGKLFREPEKYESEWRKSYGLDLAIHGALRSAADILGDRGLSALFSLSKLAGLENFLAERMDMDKPTKIFGASQYFKASAPYA